MQAAGRQAAGTAAAPAALNRQAHCIAPVVTLLRQHRRALLPLQGAAEPARSERERAGRSRGGLAQPNLSINRKP